MPLDDRQPAAPRARTSWLLDVATGVAVAVVWLGVAAYWQRRGWSPDEGSWTVAGLWLGLAVAVRRSPTWVLVTLALAYPFAYLQALTSDLHLAPVIVLGFTIAQRHRTVLAVAASSAAVLLLFSPVVTTGTLSPSDWIDAVRASRGAGPDLAPGVHGPWPADWSGFAVAEVVTVAIVLLGATLASQRESARALALRNAELEQLRHAEAARAVIEERLRISRELHDVVAHHLTAVLMRAQAADHVADRRPEEAVAAVGWIAEASRVALTAMRRTVGELRRPPSDDAAGPSLAEELDDMAARVGEVGLHVDVDAAAADRVPLSADADLAVRRVVLESLTNVLKHASARHAWVRLRALDGGLAVAVTDDGRPSPRSREGAGSADGTGGNGLRGLRERLQGCGGRLRFGPTGDGGWSVLAWVPAATPPAPAPPGRLHERPA
jgi:signal transduction histidine kinase